jgi:hypothetical protein
VRWWEDSSRRIRIPGAIKIHCSEQFIDPDWGVSSYITPPDDLLDFDVNSLVWDVNGRPALPTKRWGFIGKRQPKLGRGFSRGHYSIIEYEVEYPFTLQQVIDRIKKGVFCVMRMKEVKWDDRRDVPVKLILSDQGMLHDRPPKVATRCDKMIARGWRLESP